MAERYYAANLILYFRAARGAARATLVRSMKALGTSGRLKTKRAER
jgi:hypothetical protein